MSDKLTKRLDEKLMRYKNNEKREKAKIFKRFKEVKKGLLRFGMVVDKRTFSEIAEGFASSKDFRNWALIRFFPSPFISFNFDVRLRLAAKYNLIVPNKIEVRFHPKTHDHKKGVIQLYDGVWKVAEFHVLQENDMSQLVENVRFKLEERIKKALGE